MKIKKGMEKDYEKATTIDPELNKEMPDYAQAILDLASKIADWAEKYLEHGAPFPIVIGEAIHVAEAKIQPTGAMLHSSVELLVQYWVHGEELRIWYNAQYEFGLKQGLINPTRLSSGE